MIIHSDKETVVELIPHKDPGEGYLCPRCYKRYRSNIFRIKYCSKCGQHIAPYMMLDKERVVKEAILSETSLEDLENK